LTFKTYNAQVTGKFERSEIRHLIEKLDNAIVWNHYGGKQRVVSGIN